MTCAGTGAGLRLLVLVLVLLGSDGGDATCPMTITIMMSSPPHTGLQKSVVVQSPPLAQGQVQINHPPSPDNPSLAPAPLIVPQNTGTQRRLPPPGDTNDSDIDPCAQEKLELRTLASAYPRVDHLSLANALVSLPSKSFGHIPNVPIFATWDKR